MRGSDNFFDLGGHSILATHLLYRIRSDLRVQVPMTLVYQCPTLAHMVAEVERLQGGPDLVPAPAPPQSQRERSYAADLDDLVSDLGGVMRAIASLAAHGPVSLSADPCFLLTGGTGRCGQWCNVAYAHPLFPASPARPR